MQWWVAAVDLARPTADGSSPRHPGLSRLESHRTQTTHQHPAYEHRQLHDGNHGFRVRGPDKGARSSFTTHALRIDHLRGQPDLAGGGGSGAVPARAPNSHWIQANVKAAAARFEIEVQRHANPC